MFYFLQTIVHYGLHLLVPGLFSKLFYKEIWQKAWLLVVFTMLVDLDHLLTDPIFEAARCSINFHPLHSYYATSGYFLLLLVPNTYIRIIATGLLFHLFTDWQDCLWGTTFLW